MANSQTLPVVNLFMIFIALAIALTIAISLWLSRAVAKRDEQPPAETYDEYLDQTCELNYKPDDN